MNRHHEPTCSAKLVNASGSSFELDFDDSEEGLPPMMMIYIRFIDLWTSKSPSPMDVDLAMVNDAVALTQDEATCIVRQARDLMMNMSAGQFVEQMLTILPHWLREVLRGISEGCLSLSSTSDSRSGPIRRLGISEEDVVDVIWID